MNWDHANPFLMDIEVTSGHIDRLGHVNNQEYLKWFEEISWLHIEENGMTWTLQEHLGKAMAITRTEIDYLTSAYEADTLQVATWIDHCDGRLNSSRVFQLVRRSDQKTLVRAKSFYVCVNLKNGKPTRMPKEIAEVLNTLACK